MWDDVRMRETEGRFLRECVGEEPLAREAAFVIWGCRGGDYLVVDVSDTEGRFSRGVKEHDPKWFQKPERREI